jgi:hypothetical protein
VSLRNVIFISKPRPHIRISYSIYRYENIRKYPKILKIPLRPYQTADAEPKLGIRPERSAVNKWGHHFAIAA